MTSPVVSNYRGRAAASVHGGSGYWRMMRAAVAAAQSRRSGEVLPALPWHRAAEWARCPAGKCLMHLHSCSTQHHLYAGMARASYVAMCRAAGQPSIFKLCLCSPTQERCCGAAHSSKPFAGTQPHTMVRPPLERQLRCRCHLCPTPHQRCVLQGRSRAVGQAIRVRCPAQLQSGRRAAKRHGLRWTPLLTAGRSMRQC